MLPFSIRLQSGESTYRQVIYAVKKAVVQGELQPGDRFPSVRTLSQELRINPNTAHKVVRALIDDGLLEVRPGIGTRVAEASVPAARDRAQLLEGSLEKLVVEAKNLSLDLDEVLTAVRRHWRTLSQTPSTDARERGETA